MHEFRWRALGLFASYRGQTGQWAQLLHRLTGLGIVFYLGLHILDTALVAFGPTAYDAVTALYHNIFVRSLEVALVGVVVFHALNGLRITAIDLWEDGALHQARMFWGVVVVFLILYLPAAYFMLAPYLRLWGR